MRLSGLQIVIPYHSQWDLLQDAIRSCSEQAVLIVDDSFEGLPESIDGVEVLRTPGGLGFSKAANLGLAHSERLGVQWTLVLNDDAALKPGADCSGRYFLMFGWVSGPQAF